MTYGTEGSYRCKIYGCKNSCFPPYTKCAFHNGLNNLSLGDTMDRLLERRNTHAPEYFYEEAGWEQQEQLEREELEWPEDDYQDPNRG